MGRELRLELVEIYWIMLPLLLVFLIILEFLKSEAPDVKDILRRAIISVLLLYSFDYVISTIAVLSDGITARIDGLEKLWDVLKNLGPNYKGSSKWFDLRDTILYAFNVLAYIVAYLGFFVSTVLVHFVWTILYICSPLMILMYVSRSTAHITSSLYRGLVQVVTWKILWSILGVLLLKMALHPQTMGLEDYLMSIVVNLCIGVSMLFIPIATKSLLNDGLSGAASALAAVPTIAVAGAIRASTAAFAKKSVANGVAGARLIAKPMTNPVSGRLAMFKAQVGPQIDKMKKTYSALNLPPGYKAAMNLRNAAQKNQKRP